MILSLKTEYICDSCKKDLSSTTNCMDYRIKVESENIQPVSGFVSLMNASPHFYDALHFCGKVCLRNYFEQ